MFATLFYVVLNRTSRTQRVIFRLLYTKDAYPKWIIEVYKVFDIRGVYPNGNS